MKIDGLDVKRGIELSGGETEYRDKTLPVFYSYGMEVYGRIKECFDTGNMSQYITYIFSLKNSATHVGAVKLTQAAQDMESAVDLGDYSFIELKNEQFLSVLKQLLIDIRNELVS